MFTGFIFDVEGTLIDCVPQTLKSLQEALKRFGRQAPYDTLQLYSGLDGDQTLQLVVPDADESERKSILMAWSPLMVSMTYFGPSFSKVGGSRWRPTAKVPR